jgi:hypothetical protein
MLGGGGVTDVDPHVRLFTPEIMARARRLVYGEAARSSLIEQIRSNAAGATVIDLTAAPPPLDVLDWSELDGSLAHLIGDERFTPRFTDGDIDDEAHALAVRIICDLIEMRRRSRSDFLNEMTAALRNRGYLTTAQCRGVLNTVAGNIEAKRRYYLSRHRRRDRRWSDAGCLACGDPLTNELSELRGLGPRCYRTALGVGS